MLSQLRLCTRTRVSTLSAVRTYANAAFKREDKMRYGFVGLGQMGYPMAFNLLRKAASKSTMTIFDVNPASTKRFKEEASKIPDSPSVHIAQTPKELAERAVHPIFCLSFPNFSPLDADVKDYIITMLPESEHVRSVFEDPQTGFLAIEPQKSAKLFIDSSTISPFYSLNLAEKVVSASHLRAHLLDAPVSGGTKGADAGTLTFMLGSPKELVPLVQSILEKMGSRIMWCGPPSSGLSAKLANNYILACMNVATAEAMNMGLRLGLDPHILAEVVNASTGASWCSRVNNPVPGVSPGAPSERDYEGGFGVKLMKKDLGLAIEAAKSVDAKLVLGDEMARVYKTVAEMEKFAHKDFSVVYKWLGDE
jgi:3-hydroxyisobutyrate dehydrogenase